MVRTLAAGGTLVGLLVQENVAQDVAQGRLRWLPLADAEARSHTCLYQRVGQTTAAATGVFVQFLDAAMDQLERCLGDRLSGARPCVPERVGGRLADPALFRVAHQRPHEAETAADRVNKAAFSALISRCGRNCATTPKNSRRFGCACCVRALDCRAAERAP